jgi:alpha-ribazole phosphatase
MILHFVRHGRAADVDGRCIGHTDQPLSDAGVAESRALAASANWQSFHCISSDLTRATATASLLAPASHATEPLLREMHFGEWENQSWETLEQRDSERLAAWMQDWVSVRAPGGESFTDVVQRVQTWLAGLPQSESPRLIVAHAGSIRAVAVALLKLPPSQAFALTVDHAHVSSFSLSSHGATLIRWNSRNL